MNPIVPLLRPTLAAFCGALTFVALSLPAFAQGEDFNTNGEFIGVVNGSANVGNLNTNPFTVFADANTSVTLGIFVQNQASLNMSGGDVGNGIYQYGGGIVSIGGGVIAKIYNLSDTGVIDLGGGTTPTRVETHGGVANITGAAFHGLEMYGGVTNLKGGSYTDPTWLIYGGTLNIYGQNLVATLQQQFPTTNLYSLSGSLNDGTNLAGTSFYLATSNPAASFNLINSAQNQTFDTDGQTIGVVNGAAIVGSVNPNPFTVNITSGSAIGESLATYQKSAVTMNGGSIANNLVVHDQSAMTMTKGTVSGYAGIQDDGTFNLGGGTISNYLANYDRSVTNMTGGAVQYLFGFGNSAINLSGGVLYSGSIRDSSTLTMTGGDIGNGIRAIDHSTVNVTGGNIGYFFDAAGNSVVNFAGGSIDGSQSGNPVTYLQARENSVVNVSGGHIGTYLASYDNSVLNVSGGDVGYDLFAQGDSRVSVTGGVFGRDLDVAGNANVDLRGGSFGGVFRVKDASKISFFGRGLSSSLLAGTADFWQYALTGTLLDGTDITGKNLFVQRNSQAGFLLTNVTAAPEPGTLILMASALAVSLCLYSRRRNVFGSVNDDL